MLLDKKNYLFTSESVSEGHPDKICDQISDAVLDAILEKDPKARVACECFAGTGFVLVGGEITTDIYIDLQKTVRDVVGEIGYNEPGIGFEANSISVMNVINKQSFDIAMGVDTGGAGDQGMMFGYAVNETKELMPATLVYSHEILKKLAQIRKEKKAMLYLRPDSKSQVTIEYNENKEIVRVHTVVVSTQHNTSVEQETIKNDIIQNVIKAVIPAQYLDENTIYHINPTGMFVIGGPQGDTGLTGRKIIVDTYGGRAPHGGGAFSGKDSTKVDRSAAYAARWLAKNIVAAELAKECTIQLSYAIGVAKPISINIETHGTGEITSWDLEEFLTKEKIDLSPKWIIKHFDLRKPIYQKTASYGHFGRPEFTWEKLDLVDELKKYFKKK